MAITHTKVSAIADGADTDLVRPVDWNADHTGQPTSISDFLDDTAGGTDALTTKAPTSNVMYDHGVATTSVHGVGALGFKVTSKVKVETRDMTAASGDVAYTGYGFKPTALVSIVCKQSAALASWGICDSALGQQVLTYEYFPRFDVAINNFVYIWDTADTRQQAAVKSFDADGFTLTWTKVGTPGAGTIYIAVLAMK